MRGNLADNLSYPIYLRFMAKKKYIVSLSAEVLGDLEHLTTTGKVAAYKMNHARILLKADTNQEGGGWTDAKEEEGPGRVPFWGGS